MSKPADNKEPEKKLETALEKNVETVPPKHVIQADNHHDVDDFGLSRSEIQKHPSSPPETDTDSRILPRPATPIQSINSNVPPDQPPTTSPLVSQSVTSSPLKLKSERNSVQKPSEWSHQLMAPQKEDIPETEEDQWQDMPAYAPYDMYDDDNKLIAREITEEVESKDELPGRGGAARGYTRVQMDEDAQSATSLDDNTAYLFKNGANRNNVVTEEEEDDAADMATQMQTTKTLLTEGQRIAYAGIVRLAMIEMNQSLNLLEKTRGTKKLLDLANDNMTLWSQMIMLRIYAHMEIEPAEQLMIEQLSEHGVKPEDLTPSLMLNARVKNPIPTDPESPSKETAETASIDTRMTLNSPTSYGESLPDTSTTDDRLSMDDHQTLNLKKENLDGASISPSEQTVIDDAQAEEIKSLTEISNKKNLDIDIRWTILCDLFLLLIMDSNYDARSRRLLELVGGYLDIDWVDICRFEKRIIEALEMQEAEDKENWNEEEHMEKRRKAALKTRYMMMGMATVGGGIIIGLSMGLLAPVIGAGLAAGFTTFGVTGTGSFLAGAGGAAIITSTGVAAGSNVGFKAANRRTGAVKTFEYRPLHNNKRPNLIVTIAGWLTGNVDDVRLPFSTVDPIMGDIYSVFWEPEMLKSMGDTINILATEALTQALQQILGSTILTALMAAIQIPIVLTKLAYLIDNPWTVSLARADLAGLILADSLIDRNLGSRPITLVGFSLGARVIFAALRELAKKNKFGLVQNVYIFGAPLVVSSNEFIKLRAVVAGRFVNAYSTNDWILGYLFRATSGGLRRVAGLAPIDIPTFENFNITKMVEGHMAYRKNMPKLLREVGWTVESDEFTEIEDPDPENHEKRQRELISEIEEARRKAEAEAEAEAESETKKSKWAFWKRQAPKEKKSWETYQEPKTPAGEESVGSLEDKANGILFDVDALRAEVAELAAQGIVVKELPESTLPPMKIDLPVEERSASAPPGLKHLNPSENKSSASVSVSVSSDTELSLVSALPSLERSTTAPLNDLTRPSINSRTKTMPPIQHEQNAWAEEFEEGFGKEGEMKMTFE